MTNTTTFLTQLIVAVSHRSFWIMLLLGFSAGLPLSLIFGTLSIWLNEAGLSKSTITFFSWAALGYSFKFIWAPLIDNGRIPILTKILGKRRSWLLLSQLSIAISLLLMANTNPIANEYSLTLLALFAVMLGFSSASQDIVIDAYRIEITPADYLSISATSYSFGYRLAMIIAGAFALVLSSHFGSEKDAYSYPAWQLTYTIMAGFTVVGILTTLLIKESTITHPAINTAASKQLILLFLLLLFPFISGFYLTSFFVEILISIITNISGNTALAQFLIGLLRLAFSILLCFSVLKLLIARQLIPISVAKQAYWQPIKEFINRYPTKTIWLILLLIGFYRVSDIILGVIANVFYQDIGFSKNEIATVVKTFGIIMILVGTALGGILILRYGIMRILLLGALLSAVTNLLFMLLANAGNQIWLLYFVISADNLSAGLASITFVTFLSRLTNIKFTAMQYAIFTSLMVLLPKVLAGYSGTIVDSFGYNSFFIFTTLIGLPVIVLVWIVGNKLTLSS